MHFGFHSFGLDLGPLSLLRFFLDGVFPNVSGAGLNIIDIWSVDAIRVFLTPNLTVPRMNIALRGLTQEGESTSLGAGSAWRLAFSSLFTIYFLPSLFL